MARMGWFEYWKIYLRLWWHDICPVHLCKIVKSYNHRGCSKCDGIKSKLHEAAAKMHEAKLQELIECARRTHK